MRDDPAEPDVLVFTFRQPWSMVGWNIVWGAAFTLLLLIPTGLIVYWFHPVWSLTFIALGALVYMVWCTLDAVGFAILGSSMRWTLRIDGEKITRTFGKFWVREDVLEMDGTVFQPIRLAAPQRFLLPEGFYSPYQIEMTRGERLLLFPARDEEELREWFLKIKQLTSNDNRSC